MHVPMYMTTSHLKLIISISFLHGYWWVAFSLWPFHGAGTCCVRLTCFSLSYVFFRIDQRRILHYTCTPLTITTFIHFAVWTRKSQDPCPCFPFCSCYCCRLFPKVLCLCEQCCWRWKDCSNQGHQYPQGCMSPAKLEPLLPPQGSMRWHKLRKQLQECIIHKSYCTRYRALCFHISRFNPYAHVAQLCSLSSFLTMALYSGCTVMFTVNFYVLVWLQA